MAGQAQRFDEQRELLVYYRPLGPHHGRALPWRRWWRQEALARRPRFGDWQPPAGAPPGPPPPQVLRVAVPLASAEPLLAPARTTMFTAFGGASLLLVVGLLLYGAARRHERMERALQRTEALSALGEMAAVLAHEIRTPLAAIKGNAQLIGEAAPDDERAASVVREASRLERLVNGLLDYARPRALQRRPCDPDELARRAAEIALPLAEQHGVRLISDPARCGSCLEADADQLLQALVNLTQNAVEAAAARARATPGEPATVTLAVRRAAVAISFAVLDNGAGFADPRDERVFAPFFTTKPRGTGLGLSVARQIALQHGGELRLANRPEGGARITLELPTRAPREATEVQP
jgi:signal transduction histidine kinase